MKPSTNFEPGSNPGEYLNRNVHGQEPNWHQNARMVVNPVARGYDPYGNPQQRQNYVPNSATFTSRGQFLNSAELVRAQNAQAYNYNSAPFTHEARFSNAALPQHYSGVLPLNAARPDRQFIPRHEMLGRPRFITPVSQHPNLHMVPNPTMARFAVPQSFNPDPRYVNPRFQTANHVPEPQFVKPDPSYVNPRFQTSNNVPGPESFKHDPGYASARFQSPNSVPTQHYSVSQFSPNFGQFNPQNETSNHQPALTKPEMEPRKPSLNHSESNQQPYNHSAYSVPSKPQPVPQFSPHLDQMPVKPLNQVSNQNKTSHHQPILSQPETEPHNSAFNHSKLNQQSNNHQSAYSTPLKPPSIPQFSPNLDQLRDQPLNSVSNQKDSNYQPALAKPETQPHNPAINHSESNVQSYNHHPAYSTASSHSSNPVPSKPQSIPQLSPNFNQLQNQPLNPISNHQKAETTNSVLEQPNSSYNHHPTYPTVSSYLPNQVPPKQKSPNFDQFFQNESSLSPPTIFSKPETQSSSLPVIEQPNLSGQSYKPPSTDSNKRYQPSNTEPNSLNFDQMYPQGQSSGPTTKSKAQPQNHVIDRQTSNEPSYQPESSTSISGLESPSQILNQCTSPISANTEDQKAEPDQFILEPDSSLPDLDHLMSGTQPSNSVALPNSETTPSNLELPDLDSDSEFNLPELNYLESKNSPSNSVADESQKQHINLDLSTKNLDKEQRHACETPTIDERQFLNSESSLSATQYSSSEMVSSSTVSCSNSTINHQSLKQDKNTPDLFHSTSKSQLLNSSSITVISRTETSNLIPTPVSNQFYNEHLDSASTKIQRANHEMTQPTSNASDSNTESASSNRKMHLIVNQSTSESPQYILDFSEFSPGNQLSSSTSAVASSRPPFRSDVASQNSKMQFSGLESAPLNPERLPLQSEPAPSKSEAHPSYSESVPSNYGTIPLHSGSVPLNFKNRSSYPESATSYRTQPSDPRSTPSNFGIQPSYPVPVSSSREQQPPYPVPVSSNAGIQPSHPVRVASNSETNSEVASNSGCCDHDRRNQVPILGQGNGCCERKRSPQNTEQHDQRPLKSETNNNTKKVPYYTGKYTLNYEDTVAPYPEPNNNPPNAIDERLANQELPTNWCSVSYFEFDTQIGQAFTADSQSSSLIIDGFVDPCRGSRFCLGALSNLNRTFHSDKVRMHIGKGVMLEQQANGDIWLKCLSEYCVYVQSYHLDCAAGRKLGDTVHKIYPKARVKVFDLGECYQQMRSKIFRVERSTLARARTLVGPSMYRVDERVGFNVASEIRVDELRKYCALRMSFVKGWGPDYSRMQIKETPCWVEIQLHRPLRLLDEILQKLTDC